MMESMHTMSSTDMNIMRLPSEDDPMMEASSGNVKSGNLIASGQAENDKKQLSDLVSEAEKSNSLIAYSSYDNDEQVINTSSGISSAIGHSQDVYAQLAQKEKDLVLAAELGKALLTKNEDLAMQNEKLQDDFSQRLEVRTADLIYLTKEKSYDAKSNAASFQIHVANHCNF